MAVTAEVPVGNRPLTERERARLGSYGGKQRQIAGLLGFMVLFFNSLFLIGGTPPKNLPFYYGVNLALTILGFALASTNRQVRALPALALARGAAAEALAVLHSDQGRAGLLDLGGAAIRPTVNDRTLAEALAPNVALQVTYVGPFPQPKTEIVLLLSVNGTSLPSPVPCDWLARPEAR